MNSTGKGNGISAQAWTGPVTYPGILFGGVGRGVTTNSVEDRGPREWGSGGGSPLVRGFTQFANE
jgi:hypothetical protein